MHSFTKILEDVKRICPKEYYRITIGLYDYKRRNGSWCCGGLCPFHHDSKTGNFRININNGAFICFSCKIKGGNIIDFEMELEGLDFKKAVLSIADKWGIA